MNQNTITSVESDILNDILKAINSEYTTISCYELLANQAPDSEIKDRILEIRNDEIRHYETFWYLYISLTGQEPIPQIIKQCPSDFKDGVAAAFIDEQETVDFYHDVARKTDNQAVKNALTQASADEQNHAVWFLYFLNHN
ncbi:ferritin-like domain-containing protein [Sporosarcina newyorkensis]|uniref:Rubrerythrin n=1 Tax=Sporosarcina newyorkensis TaxID=759851 RepID=A0A1T4YV70_9BACL|nr:ferritin-like domain-containing protein [Sporosarcina newyorkensis]SKB05191.1 Rubrerythrin [Sporosarcina newyorkensis]